MINGQPSFGAVFIRPHLLDLHAERPAGGPLPRTRSPYQSRRTPVKVELLTE